MVGISIYTYSFKKNPVLQTSIMKLQSQQASIDRFILPLLQFATKIIHLMNEQSIQKIY